MAMRADVKLWRFGSVAHLLVAICLFAFAMCVVLLCTGVQTSEHGDWQVTVKLPVAIRGLGQALLHAECSSLSYVIASFQIQGMLL